MSDGEAYSAMLTRRVTATLLAATAVVITTPSCACARDKETGMAITCFIQYQIDPFQRAAFEEYAVTWGKIIPRCGGYLIGYFLPYEGTNDVAWGLIGFESLAAYELYRARLRADAESQANFTFAQEHKLILREQRTFLENVDGTIGVRQAIG